MESWKSIWKREEDLAHIHGWDFSHIEGRYEEEKDLPWNYREIVNQYLTGDAELLDYDTGGGEFLLSLGHPWQKTSATEGYPPNVELCRETLLPLGIHFKECQDPAKIPYPDESFDLIVFYDVGAFVWFAHVIEWEFPGFSVEKCMGNLLEMQNNLERDGKIEGTIHRYLIVAGKL